MKEGLHKFPISPEDKVVEECAELIHALSKARRFGWFNKHPETGQCNFRHVEAEMLDLQRALHRLSVHLVAVEEEHA